MSILNITFKLCLLGLSLLLYTSDVSAEPCNIKTDATIVNGNVNLRDSTPRFTLNSFINLKLTQGDSLGVVQKGTRVKLLKRLEVGSYEWFQIKYCQEGKEHQGWIYTGKINERLYIEADDKSNPILSSSINDSNINFSVSLISTAYAQSNNTVVEPEIHVGTVQSVLFALLYVCIFLGALVIIRKFVFPDSPFYSFACSFAILLILGFISDSQFSSLISNMLAKD